MFQSAFLVTIGYLWGIQVLQWPLGVFLIPPFYISLKTARVCYSGFIRERFTVFHSFLLPSFITFSLIPLDSIPIYNCYIRVLLFYIDFTEVWRILYLNA